MKISSIRYAILSRDSWQFPSNFLCEWGGKLCLHGERKGICFYILSLVRLCTGDMESFPKLIHFHTACDYSDWVVTLPSQISFTKCPNGYPRSMEMSSAHPSCLGTLVPLGLSSEGVLQRCACRYTCQARAFGQAVSAEDEDMLGV